LFDPYGLVSIMDALAPDRYEMFRQNMQMFVNTYGGNWHHIWPVWAGGSRQYGSVIHVPGDVHNLIEWGRYGLQSARQAGGGRVATGMRVLRTYVVYGKDIIQGMRQMGSNPGVRMLNLAPAGAGATWPALRAEIGAALSKGGGYVLSVGGGWVVGQVGIAGLNRLGAFSDSEPPWIVKVYEPSEPCVNGEKKVLTGVIAQIRYADASISSLWGPYHQTKYWYDKSQHYIIECCCRCPLQSEWQKIHSDRQKSLSHRWVLGIARGHGTAHVVTVGAIAPCEKAQ